MVELRRIGRRNPFVIMAEVLPQFNARQLNNYWRNYLDPDCEYNIFFTRIFLNQLNQLNFFSLSLY